MKALAWHGKGDIRCETVPDPRIQDGRDAIIKVTACAICGSDLHIFDGIIPSMEKGDVLGHETMGEVVEVGAENKALKVGDRVVVPFTISCGECFFCKRGFYSGCERSNPNIKMAEKLWGHSPAGLFGYSHLLGGFPGGQAEYLRVPFADVGPIKVPQGLSDDQVLFLSDIFPTGYMAADFCGLKGGETVAIWGCGPVGQFAIRSSFLLGAERVIAIDTVPERLEMAKAAGARSTSGRKTFTTGFRN
jgi:threonine dehydrogenase-like Zn-dependent dehydrogenase